MDSAEFDEDFLNEFMKDLRNQGEADKKVRERRLKIKEIFNWSVDELESKGITISPRIRGKKIYELEVYQLIDINNKSSQKINSRLKYVVENSDLYLPYLEGLGNGEYEIGYFSGRTTWGKYDDLEPWATLNPYGKIISLSEEDLYEHLVSEISLNRYNL